MPEIYFSENLKLMFVGAIRISLLSYYITQSIALTKPQTRIKELKVALFHSFMFGERGIIKLIKKRV